MSSKLKDQESVIQTKGGNLFLYGSGSHGNLYAVYELLENKYSSFLERVESGLWEDEDIEELKKALSELKR